MFADDGPLYVVLFLAMIVYYINSVYTVPLTSVMF